MGTYEEGLIADMREHGGAVTRGSLAGHPLLVLTMTGARTGRPRQAILTWSRDGQDDIVAGTDDGAAAAPAWVHNVRAHPDVTVEARAEVFSARAEVIDDGPERDRLWARHVAALPHFAPYPAMAGRVIPMVRLRRTAP